MPYIPKNPPVWNCIVQNIENIYDIKRGSRQSTLQKWYYFRQVKKKTVFLIV